MNHSESGDVIDMMTFNQILEMDDDEDEREFSLSIVEGFCDQAKNTFRDMENALSVFNSLVALHPSPLMLFVAKQVTWPNSRHLATS